MNQNIPPQQQGSQPGLRTKMNPVPETEDQYYIPSGKLSGKTAIVTGGDSGIGRAVSVLFAKEGCNISIVYKNEHEDAEDTKRRIEELGRSCLLFDGDIGDEQFCSNTVQKTIDRFGRLDVLVNNAAEQHIREHLEDIHYSDLDRVFKTNIYSMFFMVGASLRHLGEGCTIINSASITAYKGHPALLDYAATKGAIVAFTRSLSLRLINRGIRVNAVAPGPVWTPLIPASFPAEASESIGKDTPIGRPAQPYEIAPCYLFLASGDSTYINGQVLHPNGGTIVNG